LICAVRIPLELTSAKTMELSWIFIKLLEI